MTYPIPKDALDDRLAFVGTTGSGKTYNAGSCVERILTAKSRAVIIDPLGVWWGLRLMADGKAESGFNIPIFGGTHGDIALTEHAGALIGETVSDMAESCIIDLSQIGTKAGERRFMLAFLTALYRGVSNTQLHLILDEADMWAPQRILDKEGEAMKLLGMMETVIRRGRIKGFIPWLITQRPAVLSKNVLSQVDGLIAFKLTSVQDRDAIGDWVEGQADKGQWREMWGNMATLARGQGLIWIPARAVLKTAQFPEKVTFDSSRTPKRGETMRATELKELHIGKLKIRLSKIETEAKANDPAKLRAEIARLTAELTKTAKNIPANIPHDPQAIEKARSDGYETGLAEGLARGENRAKAALAAVGDRLKDAMAVSGAALEGLDSPVPPPAPKRPPSPIAAPARPARPPAAKGNGSAAISGSEQKIVDAIMWWNTMGIEAPSHPQVAFVAGYSHKSGTWATYLSRLRSAGLIEGRGDLVLTDEGVAVCSPPQSAPTGEHLRALVIDKIDAPLRRILAPILTAYPRGLSHTEAADAAEYSPTSGTWATYLSRLRTLDLIEGRGELKAQAWLFP